MGSKYTWNGQHHCARVMVTGLEKFLKYIAGHMIMVKMEGIYSANRTCWCRMKAIIKMPSISPKGRKRRRLKKKKIKEIEIEKKIEINSPTSSSLSYEKGWGRQHAGEQYHIQFNIVCIGK